MATEKPLLHLTRAANADLSSYQHYVVKLNSSEKVLLCSTQGEMAFGVLQDAPDAANKNASVMIAGISKVVAGAAISMFDPLTVNSSGQAITANDSDEHVFGIALKAAAASGVKIPVFLAPMGALATLSRKQVFTSSADYSSSGQYTAMNAHTTAGQVVQNTSAGTACLGVLQNAPASAAEAEVICQGPCTAKAGTAGVTAGDALAVEASTGKLVTAAAGDMVVGFALADIAANANGAVFLCPAYLYSVDGVALARGSIWAGNSSGVAAALSAKGSGKILVGDGTDVASVSPSNDITSISGAGVVTLRKSLERSVNVSFDSAAVIASNATPLVMLDHSAMVASGEIAAGDVLLFHDAILQMNGGSAAYDQNQNFIAKYQTAGGGATVSTTLANFCNAAADGAMSSLKQITTDITPEADQDIVLTSSASPKNATGDRGLNVQIYYSVYTPV